MLYTEMTKKAMKFCYRGHKDQFDKSGIPYVFHPIHLAEQMTDEDTTIVALLHDLVEDTEFTLEDLRKEDFSETVVEAVALMTHAEGVPYMEYVAKIKENPVARAVKLADLTHNSDITRLDTVDEKALSRRKQYAEAIQLLTE